MKKNFVYGFILILILGVCRQVHCFFKNLQIELRKWAGNDVLGP